MRFYWPFFIFLSKKEVGEPTMKIKENSELLTQLVEEFKKNSIRYCILRNYHELPSSWEGDLDILIHPDHYSGGIQILNKMVKEHELLTIFRLRSGSHDQVKIYIPRGPIDSRIIALDFQTSLANKGIIYLEANTVFKNTEAYNGFTVTKPGCLGAILLLHCIIDKGYFKEAYWNSIILNYAKAKEEFQEVISEAVGEQNAERILSQVARANQAGLVKSRDSLMKYFLATNKKNGFERLKYIAKMGTLKLVRYVSRPAPFITLLGPDGSGKTTIAEELIKALKDTTVDSEYIYLGSKNQTLSSNIKDKLKINKNTEKPKTVKTITRDIVAVMYHIFRYCITYFKKVYPLQTKRTIVIGDRYYFDLFSSPWYYTPAFVKKFFIKFMINPNKTFLLVNDPSVIYRRKQEKTVEEIDFQIKRYQEIGSYLKNYEEISTNDSIENITGTILNKVMELNQVKF
jgi:thymidylate kinase